MTRLGGDFKLSANTYFSTLVALQQFQNWFKFLFYGIAMLASGFPSDLADLAALYLPLKKYRKLLKFYPYKREVCCCESGGSGNMRCY